MSIIDHYDTIAAISTPSGVGGIAVIRLSGKEAYSIALRGIILNRLDVRYAHFTKVLDTETQEIIDDVVVTYFKAPASYTGDDTIEISCHGGYAAAPAILELYYKLGARPALPGEFTRRAFMNGKMDNVRIYRRALSAEEIEQLYQEETPIELAWLEIAGPNQIGDKLPAQYRATAHYDDDSTMDVTDSTDWLAEPNSVCDIDNTGLVEILQRLFRDVGNITGDLFRTELGIAGHDLEFLNVN